jgi:hypothetical protein
VIKKILKDFVKTPEPRRGARRARRRRHRAAATATPFEMPAVIDFAGRAAAFARGARRGGGARDGTCDLHLA